MISVLHSFLAHPEIIRRACGVSENPQKESIKKRILELHSAFMPNAALAVLVKKNKIRLKQSVFPAQWSFLQRKFSEIPDSNVWLFSFMDYSDNRCELSQFLLEADQLGKKRGVKVLNSWIESRDFGSSVNDYKYPIMIKPRVNGVHISRQSNRELFQVCETESKLLDWKRAHTDRPDEFILEPYMACDDRFKPFKYIERWIVIGEDLTVRLSISADQIIKQNNSVYFYLRDSRCIQEDIAVLTTKSPRNFVYSYCADIESWDSRWKVLRNFCSQRPALQIFSLDVVRNKNLFSIVDCNQHSLEPAHGSLTELWAEKLFNLL